MKLETTLTESWKIYFGGGIGSGIGRGKLPILVCPIFILI